MRKLIPLLLVVFAISSCDFLNIVPKDNPSYNAVFNSREGAKKALHGLYSFMPNYACDRCNVWTTTDEFSWPPGYSSSSFLQKVYWQNNFSATFGGFNFWNGGELSAYTAIRYCFSFLDHLSSVPKLSSKLRKKWKGQAYFLIGYYYFLLFENYGPVPW